MPHRNPVPPPKSDVSGHQFLSTADRAAAPAAPSAPSPVTPAAPVAAPQPSGSQPMSHLADKLKSAALGTKVITAAIEQRADQVLAKQAEVSANIDAAFRPHEDILADADAGLAEIESAAKQLSNS
jgi:hypothetical protein